MTARLTTRRRHHTLLMTGTTLLLLLTACGSPGTSAVGPGESSVFPTSEVPVSMDPAALAGSWTVTDADEEQGAVLTLGDSLYLWRSCGSYLGEWHASPAGVFVASISGSDAGCPPQTVPPRWLGATQAYRTSGDTVELLDRSDAVVARLHPGGQPTPGPNTLETEATPTLPDDRREAMRRVPAVLPSALTPATRQSLIGTWLPLPMASRPSPESPHVTFTDDGSWSGSDGCNGQSGRWALDDAGGILTTQGPQTLIGCKGVNVGGQLSDARRLGFEDKLLVLIDIDGTEAGRYRRA